MVSRPGFFRLVILLTFITLFLAACGAAGSGTGTAVPATENVADDQLEVSNPAGLAIDRNSVDIDAKGLPVGFTEDGHPYRGDPNAPIVIEEYSDFQCPYCARFYSQTLPELEESQLATGQAVLVYLDFPLNSIHPQAAAAANAARCAGEQGAAAYWSMHDALFANSQEWSIQNPGRVFTQYATDLGLELEAFNTCLSENRYQSVVQEVLSVGSQLGVTGTPTFFINGQILVGAQPIATFNSAIQTINAGGTLASNNSDGSNPQPQQPQAAPTPATLTSEYAAAMGEPDAPVTIVEFTDYQCPYCATHSLETMPQIVRDMVNSGRAYYILKDFPLDQLHPDARFGAVAARCAGEQDAYWEMHDLVFGNQSDWAGQGSKSEEYFLDYAREIELDADEYAACLVDGRYDAAIETNVQEGRALGVSGTPFFFVDGYPLNGARPFEHFELAVGLAEEGRLAEAFAPQAQEQPQQPQAPTGPVDIPLDNVAYVFGSPDAPITIIEYTDYQCPFCSRHFQQTLPQINEQFISAGIVRYIIKDFPLNSIHPQAAKAAEAARCAGDQDAFIQMHDLLFNGQQQWSGVDPTEVFIGYAEEAGIDADVFAACLTTGKYVDAVSANLQEGVGFGVTGTPAFFINGHLVSGAQPFDVFSNAVESLLAQASAGGQGEEAAK